MIVRVYNPQTARFLSADRVVHDIGDSQTYNRYSYCANNPVNATDPTGNDYNVIQDGIKTVMSDADFGSLLQNMLLDGKMLSFTGFSVGEVAKLLGFDGGASAATGLLSQGTGAFQTTVAGVDVNVGAIQIPSAMNAGGGTGTDTAQKPVGTSAALVEFANERKAYYYFDSNNKFISMEWVVPTTGDKVSDQRIVKLHPLIRDRAAVMVNRVKDELGIQLRVTDGFRSNAEQDKDYAKGRTAPGRIVTQAKGGQSPHNYGLAFDVAEMKGNTPTWNTDYQKIASIGKDLGLEWGGDWKFKDQPHFQFTNGLTWQQMSDLKKNGKVDSGGYIIIK